MRCGLRVKGLSWSGRGLPHFMNFVFFADAAAGRSKSASAHPPTPITLGRFIWSPTVFSAHRTSIYQGRTRRTESAAYGALTSVSRLFVDRENAPTNVRTPN